MHDVGAGWLMSALAPSPRMVALVQAATTLPVFLLALPAGALADIVNRRRMLLVMQSLMAVLAAALGLIVLRERITPDLLLAFTFALGACAAMLVPAWQAIVPQLIPREELASGVALNSVGINVSRAIGPALGGAVIVSFGLAWPFLLNAITFCVVIAAIAWWTPPVAPAKQLAAERVWSAMRTGLRYARSSPPLKATLLRAVMFFLFVSAYWALLPLIARQQLAGEATLYGILVACVGIGAVTGALFLPRLRARAGPDRIVVMGTIGSAVAMATFALAREPVEIGRAHV